MAEPTDADRQRAREVAHAWIDGCYEKWGHIGRCNLLTEEIAAAIAAARAEGFEAGLREPERRAREFLGDPAKGVSGHGK